jgi:NAD(P)-dependent dehydrogenase (short-subunit alcohol dehydrogenase family)
LHIESHHFRIESDGKAEAEMANPEAKLAAGARGAKVALVTGASSGIGRAIAERLAGDGLRVFGTSRKVAEAAAGGIEMLALDVCSDESVRTCIAALIERAGRIDVLVNNAGYLLSGAVEETTIEEAKAQVETNFFGTFRVIGAVLPAMRARKSGHIVNVSSLAGMVPLPFWGVYAASKFAVEGLTESLRYEVRPFGIAVSLIEPGYIKTPLYSAERKTAPLADYQPWRRRFDKRMVEFDGKAPGPELVAQAVAKAVSAAKPRLRYRVTREATIFPLMRSWFPASLFETGLRSGFHLDDQRY